jgi:hypothetical protein
MSAETSLMLTMLPSFMHSLGVGATAAFTSVQPLAVGSISTAFIQLEPISIPTVVSLLKNELSTCLLPPRSWRATENRLPYGLSSFTGTTGVLFGSRAKEQEDLRGHVE